MHTYLFPIGDSHVRINRGALKILKITALIKNYCDPLLICVLHVKIKQHRISAR